MADSAALLEHVKDSNSFHLPFNWVIQLPQVFGFQVTRFMVLELAAAVVMIAVFVPVGQRIASGKPPRGRWWNMIEAMVMFIRDQVARPAIGKHDADRFLPFLWTMFFFILFLNLIGLVPWCGSATGAIGVTAALAGITLAMVVGAGMMKFGPVRFWIGQVPHMDVPFVTLIFLWPMLFFPGSGGDARAARDLGGATFRQHVCGAPRAGGRAGFHRLWRGDRWPFTASCPPACWGQWHLTFWKCWWL